ncbi:MAG TPA: NB-ARC domain-containing protein, partial [Ktedonobacteraceae bacterium]
MSRVDTDATTFGELLIAMRKKGGIPQHALAEKLGVHRNTISKWERGICLPESKTLVLELAHQLRLEMGDARRLLEASLTSLSPHWHVPYQHNPFFTGREALLHHLHEVLGYKQTAVLSQSYTLSGLGGIGKTQMAVEYAYRYANDYAAILWVGAETRESMLSSFTAIADLLSLTVQKNQDHLIATVKPWLADHREWLVIFDNVEDLGLLEAVLPTARCGAILLTTRRQEVGIIAPVLTLETMTPEEGLQLLLRRANIGDLALSPVEIQAARGIVASMDGLPLALDQAGAYIAAAKCSVSDFLHLSQTSHLRLLAEREAQANHPLSVVRTFTLAFEQLQRSNPAAAELLRVCAFLAPEAIPVAFFIEGATHLSSTLESLASDPFQFNEAVKGCLTYSLLQRDAAARTVTVHRLVQAVLKGSLSEEVQRTWTARVIRAMAQLFPREKTRADYWQACERLLPHALACGTSGDLWDEDIPERIILISNVATYLSNRARFAEAEPLFQRA